MEYAFLIASACVSAIVNALGLLRTRDIRRILVFKLDHLGDVVTATPALARLREAYPGAEMTVVVGPWAAPLLDGHPAVDRLVVFASARYARGTAPTPARNLRLLLSHGRYDLLVGLRDDGASLAYSVFSGARRRVDRGTVRIRSKLSAVAHRMGLPSRPRPVHEVETNLAVVGGAWDKAALPHLEIAEAARRAVKDKIAASADLAGGYVVVHPGAFSPLRKWPEDRFIRVIRWIRETRGLGVVITGSADEAPAARRMAGDAGPGVISVAGETTLPEAAAWIAGARAMLSVDTGFMHVATAVGTPVVALVGPEDPARFGPYGPGHVTLYHHLDCSPCGQVRCGRGRAECMEAISVEEVTEALAGALQLAEGGGFW